MPLKCHIILHFKVLASGLSHVNVGRLFIFLKPLFFEKQHTYYLLNTIPGRYIVLESFFFVIPKSSYPEDDLIFKSCLVSQNVKGERLSQRISQVHVTFKLRLSNVHNNSE